MSSFKVGIIGCGNISTIYLENLTQYEQTDVVAVADLDAEKAKEQAEKFNVGRILSVEEMFADPTIDGVVNLTVPAAHYDLALRAVEAGKHVYNEKPLTMNRDEAKILLATAKKNGVLVGCAPDTVLGAGIQTAREIIDSGSIGLPLHAQAWMMGSGVEKWHPNPHFYYQPGGGPLFDMGPYYLSALVTLLGPFSTVSAQHTIGVKERLIESHPFAGQVINVGTPTHFSLVAGFANGAIAQFTASFDTFGAPDYPCIDVFGTEGVVRVADPNTFAGIGADEESTGVIKRRKGYDDWEDVPVTRPYAKNSRGLGMLDLLLANQNKRPARASGDLAAHLVDVMQGALESGHTGQRITVSIPTERPLAMPNGPLVN